MAAQKLIDHKLQPLFISKKRKKEFCLPFRQSAKGAICGLALS